MGKIADLRRPIFNWPFVLDGFQYPVWLMSDPRVRNIATWQALLTIRLEKTFIFLCIGRGLPKSPREEKAGARWPENMYDMCI